MGDNKIKPEVNEKSFKEHINPIINNPNNAIVEIIANAHDAGATELYINWDNTFANNSLVEFKDNGCGMSNEEFVNIWKELSYDRLKNSNGHSVNVEIDSDTIISRKVYGKNGKGRHSPFAFSNKYNVKTVKDGECSLFEIFEDSETGFLINEKGTKKSEDDNGTIISFRINKIDHNLGTDVIKEMIASRFLKDPNFKIFLNNELIKLEDIPEENREEFTCTYKGNEIKIIKIRSNTKSNYIKFHGISWRFGNRLFSEDWDNVLDGRLTNAKKYSFIISAEFLSDYVNETMTGFKDDSEVNNIKTAIYNCILNSLDDEIQQERIEEKKEIIESNYSSIKKLGIVDKEDVVEFINELQTKCSKIKRDDLNATVEIFIKLKESRKGYNLLHQLSALSSTELDELDEILSNWSVMEAKCVLDLIQERLLLLNELELKMDDPNTDELHELQPIFEKGLWIFGPEYESIGFTSNSQLKTVVNEIFKKKEDKLEKKNLRPDFVAAPFVYSSDSFDVDGDVDGIDKVLIVELKRGGFKIGLDEVQQVQKYIQELRDGNYITDNMKVKAYVLGSIVNIDGQTMGSTKNIEIIPMSYSNILRRAEKRLFNLRDKIKSVKNISDKTGDEVMDEIMSQEMLNMV